MAKVTREQKKLLKALKKNPHDADALLQIAWMHFENHQYNEAKQRFTQAIDAQPASQKLADAAYGLALIEQQAGHYEQAQERLRGIFTQCSDYAKRAEVHFTLAQVTEQLWRTINWKNAREKEESDLLQRAIDHYQQAIERRSEQQAHASFCLGNLYYELHHPEEAAEYFRRATNTQNLARQQACEAHYFLGLILKDQPEQLADARKSLQAALKLGPKQDRAAQIHAQIGYVARQQGEDVQAVESFEQALKHYKETQSGEVLEILINLAELKLAHRWYQEAADYGERASAISTESADFQQRLAKIMAEAYYGTRDYANAEEYEQQCLSLSSTDQQKAESHLRLGMIYEHQEQYQKAADAYRKGIKSANTNRMLCQLNGAAGRMYLQEERLNQAAKHLKEALELADEQDAGTASLYRVMGDCHIKRDEIEQAIEMYGTVIAKFPDSTEEPTAREALKRFRKQFKKEIQERERAQQAEESAIPSKATDTEEFERLTELINDILDEKGFFQRLKEGLAKTHLNLVSKIEELLANRKNVDDEFIEDLEEVLILSDLGVSTTQRIITSLQEKVKRKELQDPAQVKHHLKRKVAEILQDSEKRLDIDREQPFVILVIGVNGTGKTTSIGKIASKFKALGKEVMLVAGDTFRAAAIEQLEVWGERTGCEVVKHTSGADPSAVMFDAIQAAKSRKVDVVIADTAGRLHTKKNLMEELKKMVRVIARELPGAPHEILMVVDATTGQNAISQAQLFHEGVGLTGLILTKLDGTAKGGIIVSIANDLKIPVTFIGIGEKVEDLREFHAKEFVEALFED